MILAEGSQAPDLVDPHGLTVKHTTAAEIAMLDDRSIDLVCMDPPYMNTDLKLEDGLDPTKFRHALSLLADKIKDNGWIFIFGSLHLQAQVLPFFRPKFDYVWVKPAPVMSSYNAVRPLYQHETIYAFNSKRLRRPTDLYFDADALRTHGHRNYKGNSRPNYKVTEYRKQQRVGMAGVIHGVSDGSRKATTLLHFPTKQRMSAIERTPHPTQKPVALIEYIIRGYCPPNGLVLDPFLGSGTTCVAARLAGRRAIGYEPDAKWHAVAVARCSEPLFESASAPPAQNPTAPAGPSDEVAPPAERPPAEQ